MKRTPFVSFVGGGPGDPELVTLKALRRLREAAVIIHDRLIPMSLLEEAPRDAEIIDAGKAPGRHCLGQGQINALLVDRARRCGPVVRLKGGDPAIFARLAEEIVAVRAASIGFEVVPGVSAAMAAAARVAISLTERGRAATLTLAAGTDHAGAAVDWDALGRAEGTLAVYMPVEGLESLTTALLAAGRDEREPALVVERIGLFDEQFVAGRLGNIAERARIAGVAPPALLLVGPTVAAASVPLTMRRATFAGA